MHGKREEETLFSNKKKRIIQSSIVLFLIFIGVIVYKKGICMKVVISGSMEPGIRVGSICIIESTYPMERICVGDVIAFSSDEKTWVTHRVVKILKEGQFLTKGDANETEDFSPIEKEQYKGKTIGVIPYVGIVCLILNKKRRILAALFLITCALAETASVLRKME